MKRNAIMCAIVMVALGTALGCRPCDSTKDSQSDAPASATVDAPEAETPADETKGNDDIDVENADSPEGVVNAFFKSFFSGDGDSAFALLSEKARSAQRDQFVAQASETIRWRVVRKSAPRRGRLRVWVDVEDYAESGDIQMDTLSFDMTNDAGAWRVAGFNVGDLIVNFEDSVIASIERARDASNEEPPRAALQTEETVLR